MKNSFLNHRSSLGVPPEFFGATGVGNDAAALNLWLAADIFKRVGAEQFYSFSSALTIPNGTVIEGTLNLIWTGAGSVPVMTIGNDCEIQNLWISTPATTGNSMTIGTGYKGESLVASGFGNSGAGFLTIADTAGLDLDLLESTGGFQRAFTLGNDSAWSSGGRVGMLRVRDYTRGVGLNYLDGFRLEGYDIQGRNALASRSPGHNGILASGLRNCRFGAGAIEGAGEHLFRLAGSADRGSSFNNKFGHMTLDGPGGSFIKINADAIAHDFQFEGIDGVGRFASVPGGNSEFIRGTGCQNILFGPCRLVVGEGSAYSAQDALALNNVIKLSVQSLHVEGLGQSVVDFAGNQDIGGIIGNGDVRDITIGSLTGTDLTSRTMVRFALTSGFEASGLHISGVDYFSDGPLFAANGATVVDGPCSISGRFRKTDLTTLPATTNMPASMALDLEIGQRRAKNFGGALAWADLPTPWDFGAVGLADDTVALQAWATAIQGKTGYLPPDSHFRTTTEILLNSNGTSIIGTGTIEQLTFGFAGFIIDADNCEINGPRGLNTQPKTLLSSSLAQRFRGDSARARAMFIYNAGHGNTFENIRQTGFVGTVHNAGPRVWTRNKTIAGATATTFPLVAEDARADGFYVGSVIRVLGGGDSDFKTITAYDGTTNTVTISDTWTVAQNGSGIYYVIYLERQRKTVLRNVEQTAYDFGILATWVDDLVVDGLVSRDGEQTQSGSAPPHAIYVTGDSGDENDSSKGLRSRNILVDGLSATNHIGSAYKFRGVDGMHFGDTFAEGCRGVAVIEHCANVTGSSFTGRNLGENSTGRPVGVTVTGGRGVKLGVISAHFSPNYVKGTAAVSYHPVGLMIQSDADASGLYAQPEDVTWEDVSAIWEPDDAQGLITYGVLQTKLTGATVTPAVIRCRGGRASASGTGDATGIFFVDAEFGLATDLYAYTSDPTKDATFVRFGEAAVSCDGFYEASLNPLASVINDGTDCRSGSLGDALYPDLLAAIVAETSADAAAADASRILAETAAANAQSSALTCATWATLLTLSGTVNGQGAEVLDTDLTTHLQASATGYDGASVNSAGRYSWNSTWSRWVRIGDTGLSAKLATDTFATYMSVPSATAEVRFGDDAGFDFVRFTPDGMSAVDYEFSGNVIKTTFFEGVYEAGDPGFVLRDPLGFFIDLTAQSESTVVPAAPAIAPIFSDTSQLLAIHSFFAGLLRGEAITAKIAVTGDSWSQRLAIPQSLADQLYNAYGRGADGWICPGSTSGSTSNLNGIIATVTGWTNNDITEQAKSGSYSPDGFRFDATGTSATMSFTGITAETLSLYYLDTGGTFRWRVDGGAWATVVGGNTAAPLKVSVSGLAAGTHSLEIDTTGNAGTVSIFGAYATGLPGVELNKIGNGSAVASDYASIINDASVAYIMADIAPHLTIIMLGTNDYRFNVPPASFKADQVALASKWLGSNDLGSVLFASPPRNGSDQGGTYTMGQYAATAIEASTEFSSVAYADFSRQWKAYAEANALGNWVDVLHLSNKGALLFARTIFRNFLEV